VRKDPSSGLGRTESVCGENASTLIRRDGLDVRGANEIGYMTDSLPCKSSSLHCKLDIGTDGALEWWRVLHSRSKGLTLTLPLAPSLISHRSMGSIDSRPASLRGRTHTGSLLVSALRSELPELQSGLSTLINTQCSLITILTHSHCKHSCKTTRFLSTATRMLLIDGDHELPHMHGPILPLNWGHFLVTRSSFITAAVD